MKFNLEELKLKFFNKNTQICIINDKGNIIKSCNSIFNFDKFKTKQIFDSSPFLESLKDVLFKLKPKEELNFTRLDISFDEKRRFLDFSFAVLHENNQHLVLWFISDKTNHYSYLLEVIQQRNEKIIAQELIRSKHFRDRLGLVLN